MKAKKYLLAVGLAAISISTSVFAHFTIEFRVHNNSDYTWYPTITDARDIVKVIKKHAVTPNGKHTEPKLLMGDAINHLFNVTYEAKENGKVIARCVYRIEIDNYELEHTKQTKLAGLNDEGCGFARSPLLTFRTVEIHPILDYTKKAA